MGWNGTEWDGLESDSMRWMRVCYGGQRTVESGDEIMRESCGAVVGADTGRSKIEQSRPPVASPTLTTISHHLLIPSSFLSLSHVIPYQTKPNQIQPNQRINQPRNIIRGATSKQPNTDLKKKPVHCGE